MAPDALRMLARQLRLDPNPDAIEDAACALEALAIERERPPGAAESSLGANSGLSRPNGLSPGSPSAFRASAVAFAGPS